MKSILLSHGSDLRFCLSVSVKSDSTFFTTRLFARCAHLFETARADFKFVDRCGAKFAFQCESLLVHRAG